MPVLTQSTQHRNDSERSIHRVYSTFLGSAGMHQNLPAIQTVAAQHKTLLSTLYAGQDQYILDVWHEVGPNNEDIIKTLANSKTASHFVFIRDDNGATYTAIKPQTTSYQSSVVSPIVPKEVYAAAPSRVLFITDADNFTQKTVLTAEYTFGSVCDTTDLQNQLAQCQADKAQLQAQLNQCQNDLAQAQSDLAACQNNLTTCQNNLSTCQGDLSTCNTNLSTCQNDLNTCTTNLNTCQNDLSTCQSQNSQLQTDLNTCNTNLANCQTTVSNQQTTINNLNQQVTSLQNQVITLQNQLTQAQNDIANLQAALANCLATNTPYVNVVNHSITEKDGGILVQVETEHNSDLYLFVKQKSTGEIVKSVRSLTSTQTHVIYVPIQAKGEYVIDYLSLKPAP